MRKFIIKFREYKIQQSNLEWQWRTDALMKENSVWAGGLLGSSPILINKTDQRGEERRGEEDSSGL